MLILPWRLQKERNQKRDRKVPDFVLDRMHASITENPPSLTDGLDSLIILDENQKLISTKIRNSKEEESLKDFKPKIN